MPHAAELKQNSTQCNWKTVPKVNNQISGKKKLKFYINIENMDEYYVCQQKEQA